MSERQTSLRIVFWFTLAALVWNLGHFVAAMR